MKTEQQPFPRSVTLTAAEIAPDLATAFRRWVDLGELPAGARMGEFLGGCGTPNVDIESASRFRDVVTGDVFDAAPLTTISYVRVKSGKKSFKELMIFGSEDLT